MKKTFGGPAIFLDRSDINTDEIIPAKYLTEVTKEALKPYCLEDLKLEGFDPKGEKLKSARVVVSRAELRLRLLPGARALGVRGQRHPYHHRRKLCPHFPAEHVQRRDARHRTAQGAARPSDGSGEEG